MTDVRIFHNLALFDGVAPRARPNSWLEVAGGRIQRVGEGPHPQSGEAADLGGRTVIPGLIDAHVHLAFPFTARLNPVSMFASFSQMKQNLANCVRSGVTTVRDVGCTPGVMRKMKNWIKKGDTIGPRIVCANSMILPPGGTPEQLPTFRGPARLLMGGQAAERVSTPDQVRDAVRRMAALGADWIKTTHTDKSVMIYRHDPPVFDDACFKALVDEARKRNRPVVMHQLWADGFRKATELGVDSMEHTPLDALADEDITRMVDMRVPIVPTLSVISSMVNSTDWLDTAEGEDYLCREPLKQTRELLARYRGGITPEMAQRAYYFDVPLLARQFPVMLENIGRLHKAGARIGCGTDSGGGPFAVFGRIYEEIDLLIKAGLTPYEALRSATAVNARILRLADRLGTIEPGKVADFAAVDGDPLTDTMALRQVWIVVKEGTIAYRKARSRD